MKKSLFLLLSLLIIITVFPVGASNEIKNIALGKEYVVETDMPNTKSYNLDFDDNFMLTDGKKAAKASYSEKIWTKFYRAVGRTITIDLEDEFAVTGFKSTFLQQKGPGIHCPKYFTVSISLNGKDFMIVSELDNPIPNDSTTPAIAEYAADFDGAYAARFVRFHFNVGVHSYADEFEVFGRKTVGTEKPFKASPEKQF